MKNIKMNMKMKNFFEYKRLKNYDTYDYKQFDYKQFTIDDSDTNGNVIENNKSSKNLSTISKSIITGNSKNKINQNWKLPTIQTITTTTTETKNITNIPATIVTSTNKAIITTIKNPLLNLDEQEEKNYNTTYNNTKYNKKKKKSKFILKTIKFPRKYQLVQQQQQQQQLEKLQQQQHQQQGTFIKSKKFKQNSTKIQFDFSSSISKNNKKKVENFKENHFYNNNNNNNNNSNSNSNSNNNIDEQKHLPKTFNISTTTTTTKLPIQTTKTIEHLIPTTNSSKPTKAKILYSIISDKKPFYTTKATSLETLTTLTTKQTKQFNLKREKEKEYFYSKPKSKIYDYMKDFLRKKFNTLTPTSSRKETTVTTTTAGSSLHDEDIYVEFPNCLLKVINNNLGSQKETFHQQQYQYQQQRSYSQHNSPRHHHRYQHLHLPLQNHYQPDTPKKLQKYPSQHSQQQQQQQSDLPSSSIDNNSKRYDVMQDVRIKLEQLHKKQQLQQQQQQHNQSNNLLQQNFQFQQQQQQQQQQNHLHNYNHNHNQIQNQNQNKNQNLNHNNSPTHHHHQQQQQLQNQQQNGSPNVSNNITPRHRPIHLFPPTANLNTNGNEPPPPHSPSSEEDNSPTEMNNCRRLVDKPPLVKRITMGLFGLNEDSRPLVHTKTTTLSNEQQLQEQQQILGSTTTIDGYVNEGICEPEKIISSKFGDSCRQSLTAISTLDTNHFNLDNSEFSFKKKYMRETCSANSSPRIFGPSALLKNKGGLSPTEQIELKGAAWFQAGISREIAVEILSSQSPGQFLVRQSTSKSDCFVLTVRVPPPAPKVAHYLILRTIRGYKIKGFTKEFTSLKALITHHSVMPELLPVPLALPRPTTVTPRRRNVDDFESYGSLRLLGILNMMQSNHNFDRENNS